MEDFNAKEIRKKTDYHRSAQSFIDGEFKKIQSEIFNMAEKGQYILYEKYIQYDCNVKELRKRGFVVHLFAGRRRWPEDNFYTIEWSKK